MEIEILQRCYNHLGAYIQAQLRTANNNPLFAFIDLWAEQTQQPEDDYPIDYSPSLFIEFDINSVANGLLESMMDINLSFYVADTSLDDTHIGATNQNAALEIFTYIFRLQAILEGYTHPHCGSLTRVSIKKLDTRPGTKVYVLSYTTGLTDHTATEARKATVTRTLDIEPEFIKRPASNPTQLAPSGDLFDLS